MKFGYIWPSGFRGKSRLKVWTDDGRRTDDGGFPYYKLSRSLRLRGAKNQASMTSIKYAHLQVMATISGKFHQNTLNTIGEAAETRTSVDKMAKTEKGP